MTILLLFVAGHYFGQDILVGNYSSATLFSTIYLADPFAVAQMLLSGLWPKSEVLIGGLTILGVYILLGGRLFCSWVCPYNILSDAILYLRRKLSFLDGSNLTLSRQVRFYFLALSGILAIVMGFAVFEMINPISLLYRGIIFGVTGALPVVVGLLLFDLAITRNGWCGHLCPIGAFYSLIGKFGILKVYHRSDMCTSCNDCFTVCHEEQVLDIIAQQNGKINSSDCTKCGRCIEVCKDKALFFTNTYGRME